MLTILTGNHFTMYVSQFIMLFTLSLHSAVCLLYRNKTWWGRRSEDKGVGRDQKSVFKKKTNSGHLRQVAPVHTSGSIGENPYPF